MRTERARLWKYFLPAFFVLFAMRAAMAQVETATLLGTVHDQSGAVVPNATVSAQNVATGLGRQTVTSADGLYLSILAARQQEIHAERDRKLEEARKQRQIHRVPTKNFIGRPATK